ncbi:MAG: hypothetical protein ACREF4_17445, partial [Gammaproteobacteria bacterium]
RSVRPRPGIYVVLRKVEPSERTAGNDVGPFAVTASPYDAEGWSTEGQADGLGRTSDGEGLMADRDRAAPP